MHFVLYTVFGCLSTCYCFIATAVHSEENRCDLLKQQLQSSRVSVQITKTGFHRELLTTVELRPDVPSGLGVLLIHRWPRGVYVDPFQLATLSQQSHWQMSLDSAVDLEAAAHQAEGFVTRVYPAVDGPTIRVTIPFHFRYHQPRYDGETFTTVEIEPPQLLLRTEGCLQLSGSEPHATVDAPCTHSNASTCPWVRLQQQERGPVGVGLPVGDGSLVAPVSAGTLLVTTLCCVSLSTRMWKHRIV
uniref:Phosphatidylinositol-glycan biosynthesis class X protein n=1 Tax=Gasterosteus aculeatus aculeatus TaxID=481459 RepID=A0AAQ4RMJ0_GASAC|nr:phosphatidylinositol-glycan biosynthesis class X protein isoform X1 [Gasterosteus aculeatus aculeatus]